MIYGFDSAESLLQLKEIPTDKAFALRYLGTGGAGATPLTRQEAYSHAHGVGGIVPVYNDSSINRGGKLLSPQDQITAAARDAAAGLHYVVNLGVPAGSIVIWDVEEQANVSVPYFSALAQNVLAWSRYVCCVYSTPTKLEDALAVPYLFLWVAAWSGKPWQGSPMLDNPKCIGHQYSNSALWDRDCIKDNRWMLPSPWGSVWHPWTETSPK